MCGEFLERVQKSDQTPTLGPCNPCPAGPVGPGGPGLPMVPWKHLQLAVSITAQQATTLHSAT